MFRRLPSVKFVLITAGSPCQDLSGLNAMRRGLSGNRSKLFFEVVRIWQLVKRLYPKVSVTLMVENVDSMSAESQQSISGLLECQPVFVDASDVTDARRPRLYWINSDLQWKWCCHA
eukprot:7570449-Karenia_brevis.AAC.1